jgi:Dolichyl-phosphate-mannose-protein mannosyltransferase
MRPAMQYAEDRSCQQMRFFDSAVALPAIVGFALTLRLYLCLTSYCISGDGIAYLSMAGAFAAGEWRRALAPVFSPLYPLLVALGHCLIHDWELAGSIVSTILGTSAVISVYLLTRQVFLRRDIALGAAALMALHPEMAAYSASVRTEAGYIFLTTAACWLSLKAVDDRRLELAAIAGITAGLGYLYRTEGIGLLIVGALFFISAAVIWNKTRGSWAAEAAGIFVLAFVLVASPYLGYLRLSTGHWTIGREFTAAMMYRMGDVAEDSSHWHRLAFTPGTSPLTAIYANPKLYGEQIAGYFAVSAYSFVQGLDVLLLIPLIAGLWSQGRAIFKQPGEALLATFVIFYFCGFALSYTGTRFMTHLVPYAFGWVVVGVIYICDALVKWLPTIRPQAIRIAVPAAIAIILLPRALWPIGYDLRGLRYAGEDIARMGTGPVTLAARDGRVAYYAQAHYVELPSSYVGNFCTWLNAGRMDYLMIGNRDERLFNVSAETRCLELLKRYPRYGSGYYDLYAVRPVRSGKTPAVMAR